MKKILSLSLLLVSFAAKTAVEIRPYTEADKDAVMELAFQDPMSFFCGSAVVKKGFMTKDTFESENKKGMELILADSMRKKYVMVIDGKDIGFVEFFKTQEPNLEAIKEQFDAQGIPFDEQQVTVMIPGVKRSKAESQEFVVVECCVIEKNLRGKGYGRQLMAEVERLAKESWPTLNTIQLNTNADNESAQKLYKSLGYERMSATMPALEQMEIAAYKKEFK